MSDKIVIKVVTMVLHEGEKNTQERGLNCVRFLWLSFSLVKNSLIRIWDTQILMQNLSAAD